jgi:hypothetical protein
MQAGFVIVPHNGRAANQARARVPPDASRVALTMLAGRRRLEIRRPLKMVANRTSANPKNVTSMHSR